MEKVKWLCDISCAIGREAQCVEVDEGIGSYEYWGAKYRDRRMVWKVQAGSCELDVTDCVTDQREEEYERSAIPVWVEATASGDGAHDRSITVEFDAWLDGIKWDHLNRCIATYAWDGE